MKYDTALSDVFYSKWIKNSNVKVYSFNDELLVHFREG